jgi:hypothetical protein
MVAVMESSLPGGVELFDLPRPRFTRRALEGLFPGRGRIGRAHFSKQ